MPSASETHHAFGGDKKRLTLLPIPRDNIFRCPSPSLFRVGKPDFAWVWRILTMRHFAIPYPQEEESWATKPAFLGGECCPAPLAASATGIMRYEFARILPIGSGGFCS